MTEKDLFSPSTTSEYSEMLNESVREFFRKPKPWSQNKTGLDFYSEEIHIASIGVFALRKQAICDLEKLLSNLKSNPAISSA